MSFENLEAKGDPEVNGRNLDLLLYPNENGDSNGYDVRGEAKYDIRYALEEACDQLLDSNSIDYYEINLYQSETECNYVDGEDDGSTYFGNFKSWINNNYGTRRGVHLGVTEHTNFANAEIVGKGETAWVANTKAFVGVAGGYDVTSQDIARWKNLAIQEPIHNMVTTDYSYVDNMIEGDEHDLGKITSDDGPSTPMLTFYERSDTHPSTDGDPDRSEKGDCQTKNATWNEQHDKTLTSCTEDAVYWTAKEET